MPEGVVMVAGPGAVAGVRIAAQTDTPAPTVLWLFDAPLGRDMPGLPLSAGFKKTGTAVKYVSSYAGAVKVPVSYQPGEISPEDLERLKAVGYIK